MILSFCFIRRLLCQAEGTLAPRAHAPVVPASRPAGSSHPPPPPPPRSSPLPSTPPWLCWLPREPCCGDAFRFLFFHLRLSGVGVPRPRGVRGGGGMAAGFYLLCRADPGCSRGLGHRHSLSAQMSLWEVSGHILFLFLFFAHFLIVSSSHPFDLFQKPAVCVVCNDSLACLFFFRLVGPSFSH